MISRILLTLVLIFAGATLGLGLGLYVGWVAWPVNYVNTGVDVLRNDYQQDYVVMVASAYAWEDDLDRARTRLRALNPTSALIPLEAVIATLQDDPNAAADLQRLNRLALDLRIVGEPSATGTVPPDVSPSPTPLAP